MLELAVAGTPYEIGQQHGTKAAALVAASVAFYAAKFRTVSRLEWPQVQEVALAYVPTLGERWPDLLQEMRGIADGSGRPLSDIIALNVRTEIAFGAFSDACTAVGWRTKDGTSFLGQNWDWELPQKPNLVLLTIQQPPRPTIKMVTEAGIIGKIGLNSRGVGVCLNAIRARGADSTRLPVHLALRAALDSESRAAATALLTQNGVASSCHILLGDATGSVGLEFSAVDCRELAMDAAGRVVHCNHFLLEHAPEVVDSWSFIPDTHQRLRRADELLGVLGPRPSFAQLQGVFTDTQGHPASICRGVDDPVAATLFHILMDLTACTATVLEGRPNEPEGKYELSF